MPRPKSLVVVNLRAQPVEIYHGGEVVVVPAFDQTEFPELPGEGRQLAELARRGAVAVHTTPAEVAAKKRVRRTEPARPRSTGASSASQGRKKPKPKSPEGGT